MVPQLSSFIVENNLTYVDINGSMIILGMVQIYIDISVPYLLRFVYHRHL